MASDFKSIPKIIREDMTELQRKKLYRRINAIFNGMAINNVASAMKIINSNTNLKNNVLSILTDYLKNDMGLDM